MDRDAQVEPDHADLSLSNGAVRDTGRAARKQPFTLRPKGGTLHGVFVSVHTDAYDALRGRAASILHPRELDYFQEAAVSNRRRTHFLLGRYAAKIALQDRFQNPAPHEPGVPEPDLSKIEIASGVFKDPVVSYPRPRPWQASISHSHSIACAIAFPAVHPMALDIEKIDEDRIDAIKGRCLESEHDGLESRLGLDAPAAHTLLWTAKEALSKALRTGMTCPFRLLETRSVVNRHDGSYGGRFKNFVQYRFRSWILGEFALSLVLPKKTDFDFDFDEGETRVLSRPPVLAHSLIPG